MQYTGTLKKTSANTSINVIDLDSTVSDCFMSPDNSFRSERSLERCFGTYAHEQPQPTQVVTKKVPHKVEEDDDDDELCLLAVVNRLNNAAARNRRSSTRSRSASRESGFIRMISFYQYLNSV
jgi:hypothetical protein